VHAPQMMAKPAALLLHALPLTHDEKESLAQTQLGFTCEALMQAQLRLDVLAFYRLIEAIDQRLTSDDPLWFLSLMQHWDIEHFDVLGYLLYTSKTVRDSFERFVQYRTLWSEGENFWLEHDTDMSRVCWQAFGTRRRAHEILGVLVALDCIHGTNSLLAQGTSLGIDSVHLCMPRPDDASQLQAFVGMFGDGVSVQFDSPFLMICCAPESLDLEIVSADALLHAYFREVASTRLGEVQPDTYTARIKQLLFQDLPSQQRPHVDIYARRLGVSVRALQRSLRDEGCSFSGIVQETQEELAKSYLSRGYSVQECCWMLSFSEPRAFLRAFKRWTGMTPSQWKQQ